MSVIFLFIDGIGLGKENDKNPLVSPEWDSLEELTNGQPFSIDAKTVRDETLLFMAADANLGVEGLPQSGTGQAALFSGYNAPEIAGRHFGPFPHSKTRHLLEEKSMFHRVLGKNRKPHFINAYPDVFFEKMKKTNRWTCTTLMTLSAGLNLNGQEEVRSGKAITAGINQEAWRTTLGLNVKTIEPEEAADRLLLALEEYDLVMYEYYLTDKAGHSMSREMSRAVLKTLNRFIRHLLNHKSPKDHLVICSDHGNLENLGVKTHTRNPVPLIVKGPQAGTLEGPESILGLTDIITGLVDR